MADLSASKGGQASGSPNLPPVSTGGNTASKTGPAPEQSPASALGKTMPPAAMAEKVVPDGWRPKIVAFLCNWCSYAGADLAGVSRLQYPPDVRVIRVPCSGRINPLFIIRALRAGADGVVVSGCHPGDCHYGNGNLVARRKFVLLQRLLEFIGIESGRVTFAWVSASEGGRFAALMTDVTERVRALGPAKRLVKRYE